MKEELYKWYPIVDEGEYWTDYDTAMYKDGIEKNQYDCIKWNNYIYL